MSVRYTVTLTMSRSELPASSRSIAMLLMAFLGLHCDVADAHRFPGVEILTDLSAQVDQLRLATTA